MPISRPNPFKDHSNFFLLPCDNSKWVLLTVEGLKKIRSTSMRLPLFLLHPEVNLKEQSHEMEFCSAFKVSS